MVASSAKSIMDDLIPIGSSFMYRPLSGKVSALRPILGELLR